ncbi:MAG: serine/threonine protein kinase [Planctomycetaceae bacterium]|nr:serine/threonine protein kinase [Planctomycetaceae bacterium]
MADSRYSAQQSALQAVSASETVQFIPPPQHTEINSNGVLPPGTQLGSFIIRQYIGGGGMGRVYLATDTALDRDVAVKVLPQQKTTDHGIVARFMNEARSAARLNHEHIAQVYFAGEESGIPFIAFEYVEGINVRTMIEENDVFSLPQALNYLLQIAHALSHAAAHGVVHRDVKPSNILITPQGKAKLIDMGLARLLDPDEAGNDLTASGVTLGTFDYISPEQARDPRNADIRSDIYSLGCTFFFMLAGSPPFPEGTVLQKLLQHQGDAPPDVRSFQPGIPLHVAMLLQKMMAKDPKQRFQTPETLIEALTAAAKMIGMQPSGRGSLVWTSAQSRRAAMFRKHLPWMAAVAVLMSGFFLTMFFSGTTGSLQLPDLPKNDLPADAEGEQKPPALHTPIPADVLLTESIGTAPTGRFNAGFVPFPPEVPPLSAPGTIRGGLVMSRPGGRLGPALTPAGISITKSRTPGGGLRAADAGKIVPPDTKGTAGSDEISPLPDTGRFPAGWGYD